MSEGKVIILLNSCGVGERRQTFKAAWRLVFVISLLLFLIPGPEIYSLISASNFSSSSFFFPNGDHLNTPHRQRELFSLSLSFSLPASLRLFICFSRSRCVCSGLFFFIFTLLSEVFPCFLHHSRHHSFVHKDLLYLYRFVNAIQPPIFRKYATRPLILFSNVLKLLSDVHKLMYSRSWKHPVLWAERSVNKTCLRPRKWPTYTDMLSSWVFNPFHPLASDLNNSVRTFGLFCFLEQVWEKNVPRWCRSIFCVCFFILFHLAQELPVAAPTKLSTPPSSFGHYIICFYFLSSVTARQPICIIKTTFKQFAAEFSNIFSLVIIPDAQMWLVNAGTWAWQHLTPVVHLGKNLGTGSQAGDGAIAQFIHSSVSYADKYV